MTIDLHGFTHDEAVLKVENELIMNQIYKNDVIEIITGKSPSMQNVIIKEVIESYNFEYSIPPHNTGIIIVSDNSI